MKKSITSYDVLNVFNEETADIIQSFIGKDCLGLYNENGELLIHGKLGKAIKLSDDIETTFIVRFDV